MEYVMSIRFGSVSVCLFVLLGEMLHSEVLFAQNEHVNQINTEADNASSVRESTPKHEETDESEIEESKSNVEEETITLGPHGYDLGFIGFNFEPYGLHLSADNGKIHQFVGIDIIRMWPKGNRVNLYAMLGWSVASARLQFGVDVLFRGREIVGPVLRLGGRFEPISWLNKSPDEFGVARYAIGVLGQGGLGWNFPVLGGAYLQFFVQYIGGPRWPLNIGESANIENRDLILFHGGLFSMAFIG